jgi:hypothetical protein
VSLSLGHTNRGSYPPAYGSLFTGGLAGTGKLPALVGRYIQYGIHLVLTSAENVRKYSKLECQLQ